MITDYDDDTHYCIKCHSTIMGLDNYVTHRKSNCGKFLAEELPKSPLPSQFFPSEESFTLKADDFFSSLELQSSNKKSPHAPPTSGKLFNGILTRSKASAALQASSSTKENYSPSKSGKNAWIGGHQLKDLGNEDNHTKLIKAVDNLSTNASLKKVEPPIPVYEDSEESDDYDFDEEESDEDDNQNAPPKSYTGGKWKPTSSPIQWSRPSVSEERDWNNPPPTFTGGKWKPVKTSTHSPPPDHTKGKWKPDLSPEDDAKKPRLNYEIVTYEEVSQEKVEDEWSPPPSHTKGKWKPGEHKDSKPAKDQWLTVRTPNESRPFRKSNGAVQYWCGPCNRRLASKVVYDRHIKSELHFKRTLQDRNFDDPPNLMNSQRSRTVDYKVLSKGTVVDGKVKGSNRKKIFVKCDVCRSRVHSLMMGKHLVSHYHCRKSDLALPEAREMVLENIHDIVLQSPYQCGMCRFYCNTQAHFLQHWTSTEHTQENLNYEGLFWCSFCKYITHDSTVMFAHLNSEEHAEVISVINRSVPIIIKKIAPVTCDACGQQFLFNIQLRKHCDEENHPRSSTCSDEYQSRHNCNKCGAAFQNNVGLQRHQQHVHQESIYICTVCSLNFTSVAEAKAHRKSKEHRYAVLTKRCDDGLEKDISKTCEYCSGRFQNLLLLKKHLEAEHPHCGYSCPHCGKTFTIPQDVSVHIRSKACTFINSQKSESCDRCQFKTDSTSELLFHKVLHDDALLVYIDDPEKLVPQYKCPICQKMYSKASLRCHIRIHTGERPYVCAICNSSFVRKNNWIFHVKSHEKKTRQVKPRNEERPAQRLFLCSTCGANFKKKSILQQHMTRHTGKLYKCPRTDCIYSARTQSELKFHMVAHSDVKQFPCTHCNYRGKTKQQLNRHKTVHETDKKYKCQQCPFAARLAAHLKRHMRLHTGTKPYSCAHCNYRCNNLENLRKHVLSTNKHPGKYIYECKFCIDGQFQTNFARELKMHLLAEHTEIFESGTKAAAYVAGIYEATCDSSMINMPLEADDSKKPGDKDESSKLLPSATNDTGHAILLTSVSQETQKVQDELFATLIVSRDEVICENPSDAWHLEGNYDVEESGVLEPFHSEQESFFQDHFH